MVTENSAGEVPAPSDLDSWREKHDLAGPILADPGWSVFERFFDSAENSGTILIGPGLDIFIKRETYADPIDSADVRALLP